MMLHNLITFVRSCEENIFLSVAKGEKPNSLSLSCEWTFLFSEKRDLDPLYHSLTAGRHFRRSTVRVSVGCLVVFTANG